MERIGVALGGRSYDVLIEPGLLGSASEHLAPLARDGRLVVVSDDEVWSAQGARLTAGLEPLRLEPVLIPAGEPSKCWGVLSTVLDRLIALGVERSDHIVAFGGGVVGDLAGFAAAILKRGCHWVQVPTSLLAQVDSSVGGKTAINTAAAKNSVGAFHQPALVLIDPLCLGTLPDRQMRAGYAEIVKYALIEDAAFFEWLDANCEALLAREPEALARAITRSVAGKAAIVAEDERDLGGRRALLNLGHSFGHALERAAGYSDALLHGEAVAVGVALAFRLSAERGLCTEAEADRVEAHLRRAGLPTALPADVLPARLVADMLHDKKVLGSRLRLILARGVGGAFAAPVEPSEVEAFLERQRARS